jgi:hypothetical protein
MYIHLEDPPELSSLLFIFPADFSEASSFMQRRWDWWLDLMQSNPTTSPISSA